MSDDNNTQQPSELQLLKQRAKTMGIPIQGNPSVETLKKLIEDKLQGSNEGTSKEESTEKLSSQQAKHAKIREEALKLVRVKIQCMNPNKKNMEGEIFSVGNKVIGTVKKFIPYSPSSHPEGYHIPNVLYRELVNRKYQYFKEVKHNNGTKTHKAEQANEFAIQVLPPLTEKELKDLSTAQAAKGGL